MSDFTFGTIGSARKATGFSIRGAIADMAAVMHEMVRARATRRVLAGLTDHELADIGVGRGDALFESGRPMWDIAPRR